MSHLLGPVTQVTSSEGESSPADPPPPLKKQKVAGTRSRDPVGVNIGALFNQACDCSKKRKRPGGSCFLKLQEHKQALVSMREHFDGLHKLDQDQLVLWLPS